MDRRTLIKAGIAGVFTPTFAKAGGAVPPKGGGGGNHGIRSAYFNGATSIGNDATIDTFPTSSPYGLTSFWINWASTNFTPLWGLYTTTKNLEFNLTLQMTGAHNKTPNAQLNLIPQPITGTEFSVNANLPSTIAHVLASWDLTVPKAQMCVNGVPGPVFMGSSPGALHYYNSANNVPLAWSIGAYPPGSQTRSFYTGSLARFYFFALSSPPPDISDPSVVAGFYDTTTGKPPKYPAADGSDVSFEDGAPQIYLTRSGGLFTLNGQRGASFTNGIPVIDASNPNNFYVREGQLQTGTWDPEGDIGA